MTTRTLKSEGGGRTMVVAKDGGRWVVVECDSPSFPAGFVVDLRRLAACGWRAPSKAKVKQYDAWGRVRD